MLEDMDEIPPGLPSFGEVTESCRSPAAHTGRPGSLRWETGRKSWPRQASTCQRICSSLRRKDFLPSLRPAQSPHPGCFTLGPATSSSKPLVPLRSTTRTSGRKLGEQWPTCTPFVGPRTAGTKTTGWAFCRNTTHGVRTGTSFRRNRVLRFVDEPKALVALGTDGVAGIERVCSKLKDLVPQMAPVLCHGDLWRGNFLASHDGRPAVIDPAVAYTWAEVDLSMMYCESPPPERFFDAYHEVHPAERDWRERMDLLHLREFWDARALW